MIIRWRYIVEVATFSLGAVALGGCGRANGPDSPTSSPPLIKNVLRTESGPVPAVAFLGITDHAYRIVFVADATVRMRELIGGDGRTSARITKFDVQRRALQQAVDALKSSQRLAIVFTEEPSEAGPPFSAALYAASDVNKAHALEWLNYYLCGHHTDPLAAMKTAVGMKPQVIFYVLSPGCTPDKPEILELFNKANADHSIRVNTIEFGDRDFSDETFLRRLAAENGGVFKYVGNE